MSPSKIPRNYKNKIIYSHLGNPYKEFKLFYDGESIKEKIHVKIREVTSEGFLSGISKDGFLSVIQKNNKDYIKFDFGTGKHKEHYFEVNRHILLGDEITMTYEEQQKLTYAPTIRRKMKFIDTPNIINNKIEALRREHRLV